MYTLIPELKDLTVTLPAQYQFTVAFPTDQGFLGRACDNPECRRYFKVHEDSVKPQMHCPYCGVEFPNDRLWTQDQIRYIQGVVEREVAPMILNAVTETLSTWTDRIASLALACAQVGRDGQKARHKPEFTSMSNDIRQMIRDAKSLSFHQDELGVRAHLESSVQPPTERQVDSELMCPACQVKFQVDGIFGYCPGCRVENLRLYDANLDIIKRDIASSKAPERALRHAYTDLVATFETFCRKEARRRSIEHGRFQNLDHTCRLFKTEAGVNIFTALTTDQIRLLKRVFEKRHVHEHNEGILPRHERLWC
jgi:hypothetical protein